MFRYVLKHEQVGSSYYLTPPIETSHRFQLRVMPINRDDAEYVHVRTYTNIVARNLSPPVWPKPQFLVKNLSVSGGGVAYI